ncbi:condensation domain-containing protein [Streptomyces sp. BE20]|uniref:condensation domain-containing protein n=1 Tax=Streptomyces sp. BE20 TaxID=3002525 RepID=UPI002E77875A|nr:condensation domain-containing protein [Streptomyces sp. BE20]MEE1827978.1 condensation domain-containing protein [Streptomyces sp. BE20]
MIRRNSTLASGGELTLGQEALWLIQNLEPDCAAYNVTAALSLDFPVDVAVLESAVRATVSGHRLLDSVFRSDAVGRIRRHGGAAARTDTLLEVHELDLGPEELRHHALELTRRPFRLDRDPPVRVALLRPRGGPDVLIAVAHHIVADNVSQLLICREVLSRYAALAAGAEHTAPDDGAVFEEFARQQRAYLESPRADRARQYWQRELDGVARHTALPADLPRPAVYRSEGAETDLALPPDLVAGLGEAVAARNVTTFAFLVSVFEVLLYRFGGQTDFLLGYPVTQRRGEDGREAIGYFVNTLPLRARLDPDDSFDAVLRGTAAGLWRGLMHRDYPFALLPRIVDLPRDPGRPGLVPVLFVLNEPAEADPIAAALEPGRYVEHAGLRVAEYYLPQQHGQFELTLQVTRRAATVQAKLKYNTSLFTEHTARQLAADYLALLRSAVAGTLPAALRDLRGLPEDRRRPPIPGSESGTMKSTSSGTARAERIARIRDVAVAVFSVAPEAVEAADSFEADLGVDSLLAVEYTVELEKAFDVALHVNEIPELMAGLDRAYEVIAGKAGW